MDRGKNSLLEVDYSVLFDYAKHLEFDIPAGLSKEKLVDFLITNAPREAKNLQDSVSYLELKHSELKLKKSLEKINEQQEKGFKEQLNSEISRLSDKIENGIKGIGGLKATFRIIASAISIFALVGAFFGTYNIIDIANKTTEFRELRKKGPVRVNVLMFDK